MAIRYHLSFYIAAVAMIGSWINMPAAAQPSALNPDSTVKPGPVELAQSLNGSPAQQKEQTIMQLRQQLQEAKTGTDSIPILYNLFDLSSGKVQTDYGFRLYRTARRAGNEEIAFDALRNIANYNMKNDSVLQIAEHEIKQFKTSDDQQHTLTFIRIMRNTCGGYLNDSNAKQARLQELLRETTVNPPKDLYDKIVLLHALCVNLANISEGDLLSEYLESLGKLVEQAPTSDKALRNSYYVWASMIYTKTHQHEKAIGACEKLLDVISSLEERNNKIGRLYRSYAANRYIIYTRMLENYEALTPSEIEQYYKLAVEQAQIDNRAKQTYRKAPLPDIYYAYSKGDFQKVFDLITSCKDESYLLPRRLQLMRMYIEAAGKIGNQAALLKAYPLYIKILEEEMDSKQAERFRELQVIYDVNSMKEENEHLQQQNHDSKARTWQTFIIVCVAVVICLIVFMLILWRISRRNRHLASKLKIVNDNLNKESQSLRDARSALEEARDAARRADAMKTDFITNMSHEVNTPLQAIQEYAEMIAESAEDSQKKYVTTFVDRLSFNCELVNTIVNDVLQLAELSNSSLRIKEKPYDVKPICETAVDAVASRLAPGVSLNLCHVDGNGNPTTNNDDFAFVTDRHRLIQILVNLLSNAAKFTSEGEITLTYGKSSDFSQVVFTVTDTGKGIDPRYHEMIFDRFAKLDNSVPGAGLGLTISRMLAELLEGSLIIDPAYTQGARFILTLPMRRV